MPAYITVARQRHSKIDKDHGEKQRDKEDRENEVWYQKEKTWNLQR